MEIPFLTTLLVLVMQVMTTIAFSPIKRFGILPILSIKKENLKILSSSKDEYGQSNEEYPSDPNLDMFGEYIGSDDEYLESLRLEKQLNNDRWQSCLFRDTQTGQWRGASIRMAASGTVSTSMKAGEFTNAGVDIFCSETYSPHKETDNDDIRDILHRETRQSYASTDFRTVAGNQIVGNCYSLNRVENALDVHVAELAVREGSVRIRCRYAFKAGSSSALSIEEQSRYDLSLVGFTIVREILDTVSELEMEKLLDPTPGLGIYDPQVTGDQYVQLNFPGRLSLFFPRGLKANMLQVLTMEWRGDAMRFQVDRRFVDISGSIKTLELTEIRAEDAEQYPPNFVPVELLK